MGDKIQLIDDSTHVPMEDPPPYTPTVTAPLSSSTVRIFYFLGGNA